MDKGHSRLCLRSRESADFGSESPQPQLLKEAGGRVYNTQQPSSGPVTTPITHQAGGRVYNTHHPSGRRTCVQHPSPIKWTSDDTTHQAGGRVYNTRNPSSGPVGKSSL
ncbi:hypothetical protein Pcinc_014718 [Petrolisthes cinctipes]|uniref:Uncharacterized protein n=1 Tax=Petrolisthes cinctipes TaxID=88211 RepID=A0AAE1FUH3_PETCI|nr:hypothetical protein Pcinc_014718 [Petrolisthes cinctipes]